jgi:hypothetical protein
MQEPAHSAFAETAVHYHLFKPRSEVLAGRGGIAYPMWAQT